MNPNTSEIKNVIEDPSSKILIEKSIKNNPIEATRIIYVSDKNGNRVGPFIQKIIDASSGLGGIYSVLNQEAFKASKHFPVVYKYAAQDNNITIVEEYVKGPTLETFLNQTHSQNELLLLMVSLCQGISSLHNDFSVPIIHRDIKPSNIIVSKNDNVKIIDFGIARKYECYDESSNKQEKERDTKIFGTVGFAPPEQFGFAETTPQSDIYSLGKVLALMFDNCKEPTKYWEKLKHVICDKCCSLDPKNRFLNVEEIITLLSSCKSVSKKQLKVVLSESKITEKLSTGKIIYNAVIIAIFVWLTTCSIGMFLLPNSSYVVEKGWAESIIGFLIIVVFVLLPATFLLLNKSWIYRTFPRFPKITRNRKIIIVCVCIVCILFLLLMNENIKV